MNKFGRRPSRWPHKFGAVPLRLLDIFRLLPLRLLRVGKQLAGGLNGANPMGQTEKDVLLFRFGWWCQELVILLLEVIGIAEVYEIGSELLKPRSRPLTKRELALAKSVFGFSIRNYERVRIDETAYIGPRQSRFCYVSFYLINSWGPMRDKTLIHELVHVWQYERIGAVYMPRALRAQGTEAGYNYGGVVALLRALAEGKTFFDFNLEQQGDIVTDYYLLREGQNVQWGNATAADLPVYQRFVDQLQKGLV